MLIRVVLSFFFALKPTLFMSFHGGDRKIFGTYWKIRIIAVARCAGFVIENNGNSVGRLDDKQEKDSAR
ncbi:MAG: hypothetical protein JXA73_04680 [Acidobacteria bacterium]|nr:hypothetical protein [Acidobacteriota bacterium]